MTSNQTVIEVGDYVDFTSADGMDEYSGQVYAIYTHAIVFVTSFGSFEVVPMFIAQNQQFCQLTGKYNRPELIDELASELAGMVA